MNIQRIHLKRKLSVIVKNMKPKAEEHCLSSLLLPSSGGIMHMARGGVILSEPL